MGFGFYWNWRGRKWQAIVHKKSKAKLLDKMKTVLSRKCPRGIETTMIRLSQVIRGSANYYQLGIRSKTKVREIDERIRRRIRQH